jgi:hypothetical protein
MYLLIICAAIDLWIVLDILRHPIEIPVALLIWWGFSFRE